MAENILILSMTRMGDMIQTTPLIRGLKEKYPTAKITLLVTSDFSGVVPMIPDVDDSISLNIKQFDAKDQWDDLSWIKIFRYLENSLDVVKERNFDLLVNLSHSKFSALMVRYLRIKNVVGFHCNDFGNRMTGHPWMQYFGVEVFNRNYNEFNLVEMFSRSGGVDVRGRTIEVVPSKNSVEKFIPSNIDEGVLIGFQAGSSLEGRRWSAQSFAKLANILIGKLNARIVIFGVESEREMADGIAQLVEDKERVFNVAGRTNLDELSGLLEKCEYLVTNDTGTMHLAAALGTKIVGLFFAHAHPYETAPFSPGHIIFQADISCAPCSYGVHCNDIVCVDKVSPHHISAVIENHIVTRNWNLPSEITTESELKVFETIFDVNNNFKLRPLVRNIFKIEDLFRISYGLLWRAQLDSLQGSGGNEMLVNGICQELLRDYDCSNLKALDQPLNKKISVLVDIRRIAVAGKSLCRDIIRGVSSGNGNSKKMTQLIEKIIALDEKIEVQGLSNPVIRPLMDMFNKRKENQMGDNACLLAMDTQKVYERLITECEQLELLLKACVQNISDFKTDYNSHSSINVTVPGR